MLRWGYHRKSLVGGGNGAHWQLVGASVYPWCLLTEGEAAGAQGHDRQNSEPLQCVHRELENEDLWQRATIGVAMVGDTRDHVERQLQLVLNFMDAEPCWEIIQVDVDWN